MIFQQDKAKQHVKHIIVHVLLMEQLVLHKLLLVEPILLKLQAKDNKLIAQH